MVRTGLRRLLASGLSVAVPVKVPLMYGGVSLECGYVIDVIVKASSSSS